MTSSSSPNSAQTTILLVDDEPNNLKLTIDQLSAHGYRVLVAQDSASGLRRARLAQPDLILLDVILPDGDGFTLCQELKHSPATQAIPVIFMTVLNLPEDKVKAFTLGGADYVTKPLQWEEVLARINVQLQIRNLTRQLQAAEAALAKLKP